MISTKGIIILALPQEGCSYTMSATKRTRETLLSCCEAFSGRFGDLYRIRRLPVINIPRISHHATLSWTTSIGLLSGICRGPITEADIVPASS